MNMLRNIQNAIMENDPNIETRHSLNYQKAIDELLDSEDTDSDSNITRNSEIEEEEDEISDVPVVKKDMEGNTLSKGDRVEQYISKTLIGTVVAIGELIEVAWEDGRTSFEYPEELCIVSEEGLQEDTAEIKPCI